MISVCRKTGESACCIGVAESSCADSTAAGIGCKDLDGRFGRGDSCASSDAVGEADVRDIRVRINYKVFYERRGTADRRIGCFRGCLSVAYSSE